MGEEKGDQGDWGEGARREPDSDSEMDVERGGLTPTHSATCTRTSTRSPTARTSRSRKPSTTRQGQRESAAAGRDWWSSDPPLTRQLTPGWEGLLRFLSKRQHLLDFGREGYWALALASAGFEKQRCPHMYLPRVPTTGMMAAGHAPGTPVSAPPASLGNRAPA